MKVMLEVDGNIKPKENDILICGKNNVWYVTSKDEFLHELSLLRHEFDEKVEKDNGFNGAVVNELEHYNHLHIILAKSIYDNFVDRGLIENDENFQQDYYEFMFENKELGFVENVPDEFKAILNKVESL